VTLKSVLRVSQGHW